MSSENNDQQKLLYSMALQQQVTSLINAFQQQSSTVSQSSIRPIDVVNQSNSLLNMLDTKHTNSGALNQRQQQLNSLTTKAVNFTPSTFNLKEQNNPEFSKKRSSLMSNFLIDRSSTIASVGGSNYTENSTNNILSNSPVDFREFLNDRHSLLHDSAFSSMSISDKKKNTSQCVNLPFSFVNLQGSSNYEIQKQMNSAQSLIKNEICNSEEESMKKLITERIEKIDRERYQLTSNVKAAKHKIESCKNVIVTHKEDKRLHESDDNYDNDISQTDSETFIDRIYAENKKKSLASKQHLNMLQSETDLEDDTLEKKYQNSLHILPPLIKAMKLQRERKTNILIEMQEEYKNQLYLWKKKIEKIERNPKKIARDIKHREIFEKTFTELKKQREEKERNNRVERSRSAAPSFVGIGELNSEVTTDLQMHTVSIISPLYFVMQKYRFCENRNGIVENALLDARKKLENFLSFWTDTEKEIFEKKIVLYGKNFAAIAAFLQTKNVKDCVLYYYMTKKRYNYKQKFTKRRKKIGRQYRPPIMPQLGDIFAEEGYSAQNAGVNTIFVNCLLCNTRMNIFVSYRQTTSINSMPENYRDSYDNLLINGQQELHNQIPVCSKCINIANKNKAANRCSIGTCCCGKRKTKPVRTIPEKFHNLNVKQKRFLIFRLKIPPSTNKCCNLCCKKILKDVESLLEGVFNEEIEEFDNMQNNQSKYQQKTNELETESEILLNKNFLANLNQIALNVAEMEIKKSLEKDNTKLEELKENFLANKEKKSLLILSKNDINKIYPNKTLNNEFFSNDEDKNNFNEYNSNKDYINLIDGSPKKQNFGSITHGTPLIRQSKNINAVKNNEHKANLDFKNSKILSNLSLLIDQKKQQNLRSSNNLSENDQKNFADLRWQNLHNLSSDLIAPNFALSLLTYFGVNADSEHAINELSIKLLQNPDLLNVLQQIGLFKQNNLELQNGSKLNTYLLNSNDQKLNNVSDQNVSNLSLLQLNSNQPSSSNCVDFSTLISTMLSTTTSSLNTENLISRSNDLKKMHLELQNQNYFYSNNQQNILNTSNIFLTQERDDKQAKQKQQKLLKTQHVLSDSNASYSVKTLKQSDTSKEAAPKQIIKSNINSNFIENDYKKCNAILEDECNVGDQNTFEYLNDAVKRKSGLATAVLSQSPSMLFSGLSSSLSNNQLLKSSQKSIRNTNLMTSNHTFTNYQNQNFSLFNSTNDSNSSALTLDNTLIQTIKPPQETNSENQKSTNFINNYKNLNKNADNLSSFTNSKSNSIEISSLSNSVPLIEDNSFPQRSASVKAESNCGGAVSSSCYESLSEDSDDEKKKNLSYGLIKKCTPVEIEKENDTSISANETTNYEDEQPLYDLLSLPPCNETTNINSNTNLNSFFVQNVISQFQTNDVNQKNAKTTENKTTTPVSTCMYEPLSDDEN